MAKKFLISDNTWKKYESIISRFVEEDAGLQKIIWKKHINIPSKYGEDMGISYDNIEIEALVNYNSFRTWPINMGTPSGELDNSNCAILVSPKVIMDYLNEHGYWDFNGILDRFVLNGITYVAKGDTQVAQSKDKPLLFQVILKREENDNPT